jgi:hypothetical protein
MMPHAARVLRVPSWTLGDVAFHKAFFHAAATGVRLLYLAVPDFPEDGCDDGPPDLRAAMNRARAEGCNGVLVYDDGGDRRWVWSDAQWRKVFRRAREERT